MTDADKSNGPVPGTPEYLTRRVHAATLMTIVIVGVMLHLGSEVFLPLAVATLLTFALSPAVVRLRAFGFPQIAAVLAVVACSFAVISLFFLVVATQFAALAFHLRSQFARLSSKGNGPL
jgi:predicted PurR-regulated permease PerM